MTQIVESRVSGSLSDSTVDVTPKMNCAQKCEAAPEATPEIYKARFEVFMGKLPCGTTDDQLEQLSEDFPHISTRVLPKPDKQGNCCGFVAFECIEVARAFIGTYHGVQTFAGCMPLNVKMADGKNRKKIFLGGMAHGTSEKDLQAICAPYGKILDLNILSKGARAALCGFVSFESMDQAQACIKALHGTPNTAGNKCYVVKMAASYTKKQDEVSRQDSGTRVKRQFETAFDTPISCGNTSCGSPPNMMSPMMTSPNMLTPPNMMPMTPPNMMPMMNNMPCGDMMNMGALCDMNNMVPSPMMTPDMNNMVPSPMMTPSPMMDQPFMQPMDPSQCMPMPQMQQVCMPQQQSSTIMVGNLPGNCEQYQIMPFISCFGEIVNMQFCSQGQAIQTAMIEFSTPEGAMNAVSFLTNMYLPGHNLPLTTSLVMLN